MTLTKLFVWGLLIYLAYAGLLFLFQRQILFPRHHIPAPSSPPKSEPYLERIWLTTSYGKVEAWLLPGRRDGGTIPSPALIFAHGNGELIDYWGESFREFASLGLAVLLVEYPGYGRSDGHPTQETIAEAFEAAYDLLVRRPDVDPSRIILMGRSLGGGAVCTLAKTRPCAALILMSTFTSVRAFARRFLLPTVLIRDPFDNLAVVKSFPEPILVVHGRNDTLIPIGHGLKLFREARQGHMVTYPCGHNDCPPDWGQFRRDVTGFLGEIKLLEMPEELQFQGQVQEKIP